MTVLRWVHGHILKIPVSKAKVYCWCCFPCAHAGINNLKDATAAAAANVQELNSHSQSNNSHSEGWSEVARPGNYGRVGLFHPTQEVMSQKIQIFLLKSLLVLFLTEENSLVPSTKCCTRFLVKTAMGEHSHSRNGQQSVCMQYPGLWQRMWKWKSEIYNIIFRFTLSLLWSPVTTNKVTWWREPQQRNTQSSHSEVRY